MDGFQKYRFRDLRQDERIIKVIHRSWFYLFQQFFLGKIDKSIVLFAQNFFLLAIWLYGFMLWIDYFFDIWIITSERIINIEQKGMFARKASELRFQKIQDITTEVSGFMPTIFNYGDVRIQTAGENEEFIFRTIPDPYNIKNIIMSLQKQTEESSKQEIGEMIKGKIKG